MAKNLDYRLAGLCKSWQPTFKIYYTRYADNLIFSSNLRKLNHMIPAIQRIIEDENFELNDAKTKVLRKSNRQTVLGLVVNRKPNVKRRYWRNLRAELHHLKLEAQQGVSISPEILAVAAGKAAYIFGVNRRRGRQLLREMREIVSLIRR